jgi:hypothetical protein
MERRITNEDLKIWEDLEAKNKEEDVATFSDI